MYTKNDKEKMNGKMIGNELIYRPNIIYFESFQNKFQKRVNVV